MTVGIEKIGLYGGRLRVDALALARRAGRDPDGVARQVMIVERTVVPPWEDAVTLAVNAARPLLTDEDRAAVELVIVASESGLDASKSLATWVHRHCDLPPGCVGFEVKAACYAATAALRMAAHWVASGVRPGKKALVVATDVTHRNTDDTLAMIGGGCAVALLVGAEPRVLELDLARRGTFTRELADTFRPAPHVEIAERELSLYAYLDALDGAWASYVAAGGDVEYLGDFQRHVYHAPFPGMTFQAHRAMARRAGLATPAEIRRSYDERVAAGVHFARRVGTAYGASNFVSLLGLLAAADGIAPGERVSFFAYGSGCQGELWSGRLGPAAADRAPLRALDASLDERRLLTPDEFDAVEAAREALTGQADFTVDRDAPAGAYDALYRGGGLLVLEGARAWRRTYATS